MKPLKDAVILCLSFLLISSVSNVPNTAQYRLNSMLFNGYDQYTIPVIDKSTILEVKALYSLVQVIKMVNFYFLLNLTSEVDAFFLSGPLLTVITRFNSESI